MRTLLPFDLPGLGKVVMLYANSLVRDCLITLVVVDFIEGVDSCECEQMVELDRDYFKALALRRALRLSHNYSVIDLVRRVSEPWIRRRIGDRLDESFTVGGVLDGTVHAIRLIQRCDGYTRVLKSSMVHATGVLAPLGAETRVVYKRLCSWVRKRRRYGHDLSHISILFLEGKYPDGTRTVFLSQSRRLP